MIYTILSMKYTPPDCKDLVSLKGIKHLLNLKILLHVNGNISNTQLFIWYIISMYSLFCSLSQQNTLKELCTVASTYPFLHRCPQWLRSHMPLDTYFYSHNSTYIMLDSKAVLDLNTGFTHFETLFFFKEKYSFFKDYILTSDSSLSTPPSPSLTSHSPPHKIHFSSIFLKKKSRSHWDDNKNWPNKIK